MKNLVTPIDVRKSFFVGIRTVQYQSVYVTCRFKYEDPSVNFKLKYTFSPTTIITIVINTL